MKVSEIRKALKTAEASVHFYKTSAIYHDVFKASLTISVPNRFSDPGRDTFLRIEAQANDLFVDSNKGEKIARCYDGIHLEGVGHWYAARVETRVNFRYNHDGYENPERALAFFEVVKATISKYNIAHVYPECELSQILAALEKLGCRFVHNVEIEREDRYTWNQRRISNRPEGWIENQRNLRG